MLLGAIFKYHTGQVLGSLRASKRTICEPFIAKSLAQLKAKFLFFFKKTDFLGLC